MSLYELRGVVLELGGAPVLDIPALEIGRGDVVAILGPNGSGKTSLLKLLDGLVRPSEGSLLLDGGAVAKRGGRVRSVYLHQFPYLVCGSVSYNVGFGCKAIGLGSAETRRRVEEALAALGLEGMGARSGRALSGGEAQRVALARAIAAGADVLLLDEPSASADAASTELIARAVAERARLGATIVLATHDEDFARSLGPRTLRLDRGRIVEDSGARA